MKSRNIKTRLAAFGLALLMGLSPLGNLADVHAAETKNPSEPVTESVEISETEQTEEASEAAKHLVTAEDITKDISDKDFMAETCITIQNKRMLPWNVSKRKMEGATTLTRQEPILQPTGLCQRMRVTAIL